MSNDRAPAVTAHPLDPLGAEEIRRIRDLLARERGVGPGWRWASIELLEPAKDAALDHQPGDQMDRAATVVCWSRADGLALRVSAS